MGAAAAADVVEEPAAGKYRHVAYDSKQTQIGIAYGSVPYRHADYFQAWGAVGVLSGGMSARLFTEVREKRGLCYTVHASYHTLLDRGAVFCYAGTSAERAQETLDVTMGELVRLRAGIEEHELARLKARIKSALIMQQESSSARSSSLARDWYHLGRARTLDEVGRLIDELTCAEHQRLLGRASAAGFHRGHAGPRRLGGARVKFLTHVLENGLEIVAECNAEAHSTALGFFVKTGARDETAAVAGVSHFLEHMMFKGTPSRTADQVNREFDEMGAHYNACTSEENTVYYAAVLPEHQDRAVALLGDILRPSLRQEDFDTEKQVILEEIRMYEDQPPFGADDKCRAAFFGSHPLGHSVLGTAASVGALSVADMRAYFQPPLQPGKHHPGRGRADRFRRPGRRRRAACGHWERGASSAPGRAGPAAVRPHHARQGVGHASTTSCNWPPGPTPPQRTAMPPSCWPPSWATIPAAGFTGSWSIRAWPSICELNHHEYEGRRHLHHLHELRPGSGGRKPLRHCRRLSPRRGRGHHARRAGASQEQGPLAVGAFQRAAARPALFRGQRLALSPRVSACGRGACHDCRREPSTTCRPCWPSIRWSETRRSPSARDRGFTGRLPPPPAPQFRVRKASSSATISRTLACAGPVLLWWPGPSSLKNASKSATPPMMAPAMAPCPARKIPTNMVIGTVSLAGCPPPATSTNANTTAQPTRNPIAAPASEQSNVRTMKHLRPVGDQIENHRRLTYLYRDLRLRGSGRVLAVREVGDPIVLVHQDRCTQQRFLTPLLPAFVSSSALGDCRNVLTSRTSSLIRL